MGEKKQNNVSTCFTPQISFKPPPQVRVAGWTLKSSANWPRPGHTSSRCGDCHLRSFSGHFVVQKWVCLKMGYTPNYSHLVGIMIINHWCRGTLFSDKTQMVNITLKSRCFSGAGSSFLSVSFHHFNSQAIHLFNWRFLPIPGWWFGTCFIFHNIWDVILPIDDLIFFKMGKTTNQILSG